MVISPSLVIDDRAIEERFVRGSGPGGQNVNKVATAVQLRLDVGRSGLPDEVMARVRALAGARLTTGDILVIDAREHRTQAGNRAAAERRLVALVGRAAEPPRPRRPTRPSARSREVRLETKTRRGSLKRLRSTKARAE